MSPRRITRAQVFGIGLTLSILAGSAEAKYIGQDPPRRPPPRGVVPPPTPPGPQFPPVPPGPLYASLPPAHTVPPFTGPFACSPSDTDLSGGGCTVSVSEGNLEDTVPVATISSAMGPTVDFYASYDSYNADGSRAQVDTVMGYGWTQAPSAL